MPHEFLSLAIWEPLPGMEAAALATIREIIAILARKGYSRDLLYRSPDAHYVLLRYWKSEEARQTAQEDPEVLRRWAKLGNEIHILKVYEKMGAVSAEASKP